jgi:hypothetical protein
LSFNRVFCPIFFSQYIFTEESREIKVKKETGKMIKLGHIICREKENNKRDTGIRRHSISSHNIQYFLNTQPSL